MSFQGGESPMTWGFAGRSTALIAFMCDTVVACVAGVGQWGVCDARTDLRGDWRLGQTAQPAVFAGTAIPGGATSGTDHAMAFEISRATFCHATGSQPSATAPTLVS